MNENLKRNMKGLIAALVTFFGLALGAKWNFFVAALLSVGVYGGIYLVSKPKLMIGNTEIEALENAEEIQQIYLKLTEDKKQLEKSASTIEDKEIKAKALELAQITNDIEFYLENNPREISKSRHFLDYYVSTAKTIVNNYNDLKRANVSSDKFYEIKEKTNQSLDLLNKIFAKQRDSYHQDKINQLEVESDLLEQTIKLGGDVK